MLKNWKMGVVIASIVAVVSALSMGVVFYLSNRNLTSVLINDVENNIINSWAGFSKISIPVNSPGKYIWRFKNECCKFLD